jgi:hypothetical protein
MARWAGRWDRGKSGIPGKVGDSDAGRHAVSGGGPSDGGRCQRDSRHVRRGKEREKR